MIDPKPLLFANFLAIMLLVTAGFATIQRSPELVGSQKPGTEVASDQEAAIVERSEPSDNGKSERQAESGASAPGKREEPLFSPMPVTAQDAHPENQAPAEQTASSGASSAQGKTIQPTQPREPEPHVAKLTLRSNVHDDKVLINGRQRGSTALDVKLDPGTYEIEVRKRGHSPWRRQVSVGAGDEETLTARLERYTTVKYRNGTWKHGIRTGEGTYRDSEGLSYEGEFRNGEFHGEGTAEFPDGRIYDGNWRNSRMHGEGELQMTNGDVYRGEFRENEFHGRGTLTAANGDTFTGRWKNGELNGEGTMTTAEGVMYVGSFRNGQLHGEGRLTYADGSYYKGEFANNRFHGDGVRTYANGRQYKGEFVDGQFHGKGEIRHPSGATIESTFREGDPYGEVTLTTAGGEVFTARTSEPGVCYRKNSYRATQCPSMEGW